MKELRSRILAYRQEHTDATAAEIAEAVGCTRATVRATVKSAGLELQHGNQVKPRAGLTTAQDVDTALLNPASVQLVREVVDQWLMLKVPAVVPSDEQVARVLEGERGVDLIAKALRMQGYAGIFSALHRNQSELLRRALHSPAEVVESRSDPDAMGLRFAYVMGDHRGEQIMSAFLAAIGDSGRKMLGDIIRKVVSNMDKPNV